MNGLRIERRQWLPDLLGLIVVAAMATLPFLTPHNDLSLQRCFYTPDATHPWSHENDAVWRWLYRFGPWPALLTALGALGVLAASRWRPALARHRAHALYLVLTLALGPGLLVNVIFKDHWGRPRPRQVTELGGTWSYQTFVEKGVGGRGKSFPCGHSAMGYYFVAFYFLWRRRHPARAASALAFAAAYGTVIGAARMAAGGHFASDVAWSAVMTAATAFVLYYAVLRVPLVEDRQAAGAPPPPLPRWMLVVMPIAAVFAVAMGLLGTPSYREFDATIPAPSPLRLNLDVTRCDVELSFSDDLSTSIRVSGEAQGFGWPGCRVDCMTTAGIHDGRPAATVNVAPTGWFNELNGRLIVTMPAGTAASVGGRVRGGDVTVKAAQPETIPALDLLVQDGTCGVPREAAARLIESRGQDATRFRVAPPALTPASR